LATITETTSGTTSVSQQAGTGIDAVSLMLSGNAAGSVSFTVDAVGSAAANLSANLGASNGSLGTGSLTYVDNSTGTGFKLGAITAQSVTLPSR